MKRFSKWWTGEFFGTFLLVFFGGGIYRAFFKRAYGG